MRIGIPKEIKVLEKRVGIVPAGVRELVRSGHEVMVESQAGAGVGRSDNDKQFVFCNGRPVELPRVTRLLNEVRVCPCL